MRAALEEDWDLPKLQTHCRSACADVRLRQGLLEGLKLLPEAALQVQGSLNTKKGRGLAGRRWASANYPTGGLCQASREFSMLEFEEAANTPTDEHKLLLVMQDDECSSHCARFLSSMGSPGSLSSRQVLEGTRLTTEQAFTKSGLQASPSQLLRCRAKWLGMADPDHVSEQSVNIFSNMLSPGFLCHWGCF